MAHARPNPQGVRQFEFIEFAAPEPALLHTLFKSLGFVAIARHREKPVTLYRQGGINFLVNEMPDSFASDFAGLHGPCCSGFCLRVTDPGQTRSRMLGDGARPISDTSERLAVALPCVEGIGGSVLYLSSGLDDLDREFEFDSATDRQPHGSGLRFIDHLTHNVRDGNMADWADFYAHHFGFYEVRYFDIKGQQTGLRSKAMTAPDGSISIPINESSDPKSQINEYLEQYRGEGVQHIALYTDTIYDTVEQLHRHGVEFLDTPDTYYEVIDQRIPNHGEDVARMRKNKILIDAEPDRPDKQLLQIFTQTNIGPIFFEIIQRKGNQGFGEGNFTALFEAIERDQQKRGVL